MNTRLILSLLVGMVLIAGGSTQAEPDAAKENPLTILVMLKKKSHPFVKYLENRYQVKFFFAQPEKEKGIPGVAAVNQCDVILLSQRRQNITPDQEKILKKALLKDRKPIVGIRQASHAFNQWPEIDLQVFGAKYRGHFFEGKAKQIVRIEPKGKDHPLIGNFKPFMCNGFPYRYTEVAPEVEVLMSGGLPEKMQPITWTRVTKDGQRIFYTRYDERDLDKSEDCRQMVSRALFWAARRDISKARKK